MKNRLLSLSMICMILTGCAKYYRIQDPGGNREFYASSIEETGNGAVRFQDLKTKTRVTLQNSMVKEVRPEELPADVPK